ncbi:MAG TPA: NADH-quinone oxidoreductase subunit NuoE [Dehalococcoidales bacterium]|nr:NADH-quinone oxidoreductase subunit NuoE [Dehalococcoidales bacterium]
MHEKIDSILRKYERKRESLIPILQEVQSALGYLSGESIAGISKYLNLSRSDVYGVASFYAQFRFQRQGRHTVKVCQGTACHVRGGRRVMAEVVSRLGIQPNQTTPDYQFSLERVACFGACALAPVMVVDKDVHGNMTTAKVKGILAEASRD